MHFSQLGLSQPILRALTKEGYETPTPIQAIPHVLEGKDVLGCAQTGTGKTAAFALPIIQRLMDMPVDKTRRGPAKARALILSPTRELALQIRDSFGVYGRESGLRSTVIFGGVSQVRQVQALRDGVDIIIATPGRLIDLMDQRRCHLDEVKILVLDEADRMLDMGFIQPIRMIASKTPADRQTLLFSATMPPEIRKLADSLLKNPVSVAVSQAPSAAPKIEQMLYHVNRADKQALLTLLLAERALSRVVVFTKTKHGAEKVGKKLQFAGVNAETIHGNKAQNARKKALDLFRAGKARVLVATDVAARGLDVDNISHVINFDLPMEPEAYVHRIGRTARAGATGIAISFCDGEERDLLRGIERLLKNKIPTKPMPTVERLPRDPREFESKPSYAGSHGGSRGGEARPDRGHSHRGAPAPRHGHDEIDPRDRKKSAHAPRPHAGHAPVASHGHASKAHAPKPHAPASSGHASSGHVSKPHAPKPHASKPAAPHSGSGHRGSGTSAGPARSSAGGHSSSGHAPRSGHGSQGAPRPARSEGGRPFNAKGGHSRGGSGGGKPPAPRRSA